MNDKPKNPPAFPQSKPIYMAQDNGDGVMNPTIVGNGITGGMTLRDYFAAAALTGLLANNDLQSGLIKSLANSASPKDAVNEVNSQKAFAIAETMLEVRQL